MRMITLGSTGICVPQNGFGALPIQRIRKEDAAAILCRAYEGGMRFFDTARAYSDSEEKIGAAFHGFGAERKQVYIATKTTATTPGQVREDFATSLRNMELDYVDIYQFHCVGRCYKPGDGTGMYECMQELKESGKVHHIGITTHKLGIAKEIIASGLYETLQYPLSYLSSDEEIALVEECKKHNMGFIAMKGLAGGLITNASAAMAFMLQFDNVIPIWGVQRMSELEDWLAFMDEEPELNEERRAFIEKERAELTGEFCRGCGYCMPCPAGIMINQCARMSLMLRRAPSEAWLMPQMQAEMKKIEGCLECGACRQKCPYELDTPNLLKKNYEDYKKVLAGEVLVS